jgi:hypothetical protein
LLLEQKTAKFWRFFFVFMGLIKRLFDAEARMVLRFFDFGLVCLSLFDGQYVRACLRGATIKLNETHHNELCVLCAFAAKALNVLPDGKQKQSSIGKSGFDC